MKREQRIKRFGKVEPVEETDRKRKYQDKYSFKKYDHFENKIENKNDDHKDNNYLFIKKINFIEQEKAQEGENNIIPIKPKMWIDKKKEGFFILNY